MRFVAALLLLVALPGSVAAQAETGFSEARVSATGAAVLKASPVAGTHSLLFGGWAGLLFAENLAMGGGGSALLNRVEIAGADGDSGNELSLGYGGVVFRYWEPITPSIKGQVGLLVGAGHAEVRSQLTGVEVGSDNFMVSEGEVGAIYSLTRDAHLGLSLGYRLTAGVEDLPRVTSSDLNGFTASLSLRIGRE